MCILSLMIWVVAALGGVGLGLMGVTGLRPRALLASAAQSNHVGLCSIMLNARQAVGDGVGACTSFCVPSIPSCSLESNASCCSTPHSLTPSGFSVVLSCSSSLPTLGPSYLAV